MKIRDKKLVFLVAGDFFSLTMSISWVYYIIRMDNTPKENREEPNQTGSEIFSDTHAESAYQEATVAPIANEIPIAASVENQAELSPEISSENINQGSGNVQPPSFGEEDMKNKFIVTLLHCYIVNKAE